eukprot:4220312-Amphidinium_carterae.1
MPSPHLKGKGARNKGARSKNKGAIPPAERARNETGNRVPGSGFPTPPTFTTMPPPHYVENHCRGMSTSTLTWTTSRGISHSSTHPTFQAPFDHYSHDNQVILQDFPKSMLSCCCSAICVMFMIDVTQGFRAPK